MTERLVYKQPPTLSREELEAEFASDDPKRICDALFAAFYTEPAADLEQWCYRFAEHSSEEARRVAAIVLGNTAVVYGLHDFVRAVSVLEKLRDEPSLEPYAEDGLSDVLHACRNRVQ